MFVSGAQVGATWLVRVGNTARGDQKMRSVAIILTASVLVLTGRICVADVNSDAKKAIQVGMNKAMALIEKQDFAALTKMCTPDCKFVDGGQPMDVKQMTAMMKAQMAQLKNSKFSSTLLTCSVKGNIATCTSHDIMSATETGQDKKPHKIASEGTSSETFQKSGSTWLMKSNTTLTNKMTVDGKPFNPNPAPPTSQK